MGIAKGAARLILDECSKHPFSGSVLQLGRQKLFFSLPELEEWAGLHNVELAETIPEAVASIKLVSEGCVDDKTFFHKLGFQTVHSCDYSDFQAADHVFDLNLPIPEHLHNKYDLIVDSGTLEHVFHLPQALKNVHDLLKEGGRVIHLLPATNYVDHGFYMFSPTLFHDYYSANRWDIDTAYIIELTRRHDVDPWRIYQYTPGVLNSLSSGGFDRGYLVNIYFVVRKNEKSTTDVIPQQSRYQEDKWKASTGTQYSIGYRDGFLPKLIQKIKSRGAFMKSRPLLYSVIMSVVDGIFRRGRMPPIIAKY